MRFPDHRSDHCRRNLLRLCSYPCQNPTDDPDFHDQCGIQQGNAAPDYQCISADRRLLSGDCICNHHRSAVDPSAADSL